MPSTPADRTPGLLRRAALIGGCAIAAALAPAAPAAAQATQPAAGAAATAPSADVERFPEPSVYPIAWEVRFRAATPRRIVVQLAGQPTPLAYWYLTYSAVNRGDKEVQFEPEFTLSVQVDGRPKMIAGNRAIPGEVFEAIKRREGNPLLISPRKISVDPLNPGEEQSRDGVAIWEEPTQKLGTFSVFVAGLSGEQVTLRKAGDRFVKVDPAKGADELKDVKEEDRVTLRKQLQLTYQVLGDERAAGNAPIVKKGEKWVMR